MENIQEYMSVISCDAVFRIFQGPNFVVLATRIESCETGLEPTYSSDIQCKPLKS